MPWTFAFTLIGGLSISAFPFFSGFVSKSMIIQAGFEDHKLGSASSCSSPPPARSCTRGSRCRISFGFGKNHCDQETWGRAAEPPWNMMAAMAIASGLCIFIGCYTPYLYRMLPYPVDFHPYTSHHVSETLQILLFTGLGFFLLIKKLEPEATISLDLDWFYRMGGRAFLRFAKKPVQAVDTAVGAIYRVCGLRPLMQSARDVGIFDNRVIDGAVDGIASAVQGVGSRLRRAQRGALQENLTLAFVAAAILLLAFLFFP